MKHIFAVILAFLICSSAAGCVYTSVTEGVQYAPLNKSDTKNAINFENVGQGLCDDVNYLKDYKKARAVPMGKAVCSEKLLKNLKSYKDDDVFYIGVCYAAMVPANVSQDAGMLRTLRERAEKDCLAAGMFIRLDYDTSHYFTVYASKRQLLNMACSPDVALYLFPAALYM